MRSVLPIITFIFVMLGISSCSDAPAKPLTIGHNDWIGYQPLKLAYDQGLFNKEVIPLLVPNSTEGMRLFRNRLLDGIALTLDEALLLYQQTRDIAIVLVMDYSNGADALLVDDKINKLKDLKGKRIGFESNALGALMLSQVLEKSQLDLSDIIPVNIAAQDHLASFKAHKIDGLITYGPITTKIQALGGKVLFDSSAIPNAIIDVLVVRRSLITSKDPRIKSLLEGWFKVLPKTQRSLFLAQQMGLSLDELDQLFKGIILMDKESNLKLLFEGDTLESSITNLIKIMQKFSLISSEGPIDYRPLLSQDFLIGYYR